MNEWIRVIEHPLGLAGFALFIVFGFMARRGATSRHRWLAPTAVAMACAALLSGLGLAYLNLPRETQGEPQTERSDARRATVSQTTSGAKSPAVANVNGDVNINFNAEPADAKAGGAVQTK